MKGRRLIQAGDLPARATSADRIAHNDADIRDLTARIRKTLTDKSAEHTVTGWVMDEEWLGRQIGSMLIEMAKYRAVSAKRISEQEAEIALLKKTLDGLNSMAKW